MVPNTLPFIILGPLQDVLYPLHSLQILGACLVRWSHFVWWCLLLSA